ncbi:MAG: YtxH domain-containing protein [Bacillota bacterium]
MSDNTNFVFGVLAGGLVGLAAGILLAPESGEKTREKLKEQARVVADDVRESAGEFTIKLKDGAEEAMKRAQSKVPYENLESSLAEAEKKLEELEGQLDPRS